MCSTLRTSCPWWLLQFLSQTVVKFINTQFFSLSSTPADPVPAFWLLEIQLKPPLNIGYYLPELCCCSGNGAGITSIQTAKLSQGKHIDGCLCADADWLMVTIPACQCDVLLIQIYEGTLRSESVVHDTMISRTKFIFYSISFMQQCMSISVMCSLCLCRTSIWNLHHLEWARKISVWYNDVCATFLCLWVVGQRVCPHHHRIHHRKVNYILPISVLFVLFFFCFSFLACSSVIDESSSIYKPSVIFPCLIQFWDV